MTVAVHLDHDFPYEHTPTLDTPIDPGYVHAGDVDGAPVYRRTPTTMSASACLSSSAAAQPAGDPSQSPWGAPAGPSPAAAVLGEQAADYQARCELLGQLVDLLAPAGIWKSFFLGVTRRHRVGRLEQLSAEVLHTVVEQAHQVAAARGDR